MLLLDCFRLFDTSFVERFTSPYFCLQGVQPSRLKIGHKMDGSTFSLCLCSLRVWTNKTDEAMGYNRPINK